MLVSARAETCLLERDVTQFGQLVVHTGAIATRMCRDTACDWNCSVMHTPCPLFKYKPHVSAPEVDLGDPGIFLFVPLPSVTTLNVSPEFSFTCHIGDRCPNLP